MNISIGSGTPYSLIAGMPRDQVKTEQLQEKLMKENASDEELMEVCKSFETYLLTQVMKEMEKTIPGRDDKNPYLEQFGDILYEEYAKDATEGEGLGIAQMLYESMKRNM
jgi:flagellar protein FlgJ